MGAGFVGQRPQHLRAATYSAQATAAQLENLRLSLQSELAVDYLRSARPGPTDRALCRGHKGLQGLARLDKNASSKRGLIQTWTWPRPTRCSKRRWRKPPRWASSAPSTEHAIALLIGRAASAFLPSPGPVGPPGAGGAPGLPSQLLERRPDIAAAERTVAAANAQIGVARAAFFPALDLSAGAGFQSSKLSKLLDASSFAWAAGATLSETLFDAGRRAAVSEQDWAYYRAAAANYRETVLTAFQQVEDNLAALRILAAEARQQDVAVQASQQQPGPGRRALPIGHQQLPQRHHRTGFPS